MAQTAEGCEVVQQANDWAAINVLLQHPAVAEQQLVCIIAQVCSAWKAAVQQSSTGATRAILQICPPLRVPRNPLTKAILRICPPLGVPRNSLTGLPMFAKWLPKYAGLIHSISIEYNPGVWSVQDHQEWRHHMQQLLSAGLQAAAAPAGSTQQRNPLLLRSYSSTIMHSSNVLQALPGATLTSLQLNDCSMTDLAAGLQQLPNLHFLKFYNCKEHNASLCVPAISQLSKLTHLDAEPADKLDLPQLPRQLQELSLSYTTYAAVKLDLQHLEHLTKLELCTNGDFCDSSQLPARLQELELFCSPSTAVARKLALTSLSQLRKVRIWQSAESAEDLLAMAAMSSLQCLELDYSYGERAVNAAPAWAKVPQLQGLELMELEEPLRTTDLMYLIEQIAATTSLTKLGISDIDIEAEDAAGEPEPIYICEHIMKLRNLKDLCLSFASDEVEFATHDVILLAALTKLTRLSFGMMDQHVTDADIVCLAMVLTQLQSLTCTANSLAVLKAVGALKQLTHLSIEGLSQRNQQRGLQYLTNLKQLQELEGFYNHEEEKLDSFWASLRG